MSDVPLARYWECEKLQGVKVQIFRGPMGDRPPVPSLLLSCCRRAYRDAKHDVFSLIVRGPK
jgi:hypothetical protein